MTIETQVASLVTATNGLTETVTHKIDEIDTAITTMQGVASSLPTSLLGVRTIYVDQVSGNDAAADTDGAVVRTMREAFARAKPFKTNLIKLASNQTHTFDQNVNLISDSSAMGLEKGYIFICDRDKVSEGSNLPTATSPVLNWSAVLITSLDVIFGGAGQGLTLNHQNGCLHAMRPQATLGTGRAPSDVIAAHCHILLNCPDTSYPLCNTSGTIELTDCLVEQNYLTARISGSGAVSFIPTNSTFTGAAHPLSWSNLVDNRVSLSLNEIKQEIGLGVNVLYVDGVNGLDTNDGLTAQTALASVDVALGRCTPGQSWQIRLANSQTFTISNNHAEPAHFTGCGGYIWFRDIDNSSASTVEANDLSPTLVVAAQMRIARPVLFGGYDCPLKIVFRPGGSFRPLLDDSGPDQGNMFDTMRISFSHSLITLDSAGLTAEWHAINADNFLISLRSCTVNQVDSSASLIGPNGYGLAGTFHCTASTFTGVTTQWANLIYGINRPAGGGAPLGILSNLEL